LSAESATTTSSRRSGIVFEFLDDTLAGPFGPPYSDIISSGITLTILVLFFLAIVKGKETEAASTSPDEAAQPP